MFPPFPQELARHYCLILISSIQKGEKQGDFSENAYLEQVSRESEERKGQGLMIGCLVGWNKKTCSRELLFAVSGNSKLLHLPNNNMFYNAEVCPPIVYPEEITRALFEYDEEIHRLTDLIKNSSKENAKELINKRTELTDISLSRVFSLYWFTDFKGEKVSLNQIIKKHDNRLPPAGTGDCCGPRLLSRAFEKNLEIVSMDEIYFVPGIKTGEKVVTNHKIKKIPFMSYEPCNERCGYIFPSILGLEILYRDSQLIVVNKPSGLLSVPGRGEDKQDCVVSRVKKLFPDCIDQPSVHRLDMETSGLLVLAFTAESHKNLSMQFEKGLVHKKYTALLDGILKGKEKEGVFKLKFRLDVNNRPHQIYDEVNGKIGITEWKNEGVEVRNKRKYTRITFIPHTGRTHQLRLASSDPHGFGIPIAGDSLYGNCEHEKRLLLHAKELSFYHPVSGKLMTFICKSDF